MLKCGNRSTETGSTEVKRKATLLTHDSAKAAEQKYYWRGGAGTRDCKTAGYPCEAPVCEGQEWVLPPLRLYLVGKG